MEVVILSVMLGIMVAVAGLAVWQVIEWRKIAQSRHGHATEEIEHKEVQYKDSFEAQINALDEERRRINVAITEVFDFLNDSRPFGSHQEGLDQCRNVLLSALQTSTYRDKT